MRVLFVHGRAQGGRDPEKLKQEWIDTLTEGLASAGVSLPPGTTFDFPFYGDVLDEEVEKMTDPKHQDANAMGDGEDEDYEEFLALAMEELSTSLDLPTEEIRAEMDDSVGEMGPQNWEWVQAIVKVIDKRWTGLSSLTIEVFLRDVFLYLTSRRMQRKINAVVEAKLTDEPTLVVSHSLGTVVCYNIFKDRDPSKIKGFITLGSPLGIKAVSGRLGKPKHPSPEREWYNAYDERDVVALNPLDNKHFPTNPSIKNNNDVRNDSKNRHSITGYLDDATIAKKIAELLT